MLTIVGISGSLRRASLNSALLRAAATLMPEGSTLIVESIAGSPLYNADDEDASGIPPPVARLKDAIATSDGLLLVTPEYNNGIPGVTKNAIDWLSRPSSDAARVFRGRAVAIAGASPGRFGTILSQNAWLSVFRTLKAEVWAGGRLLVSHADSTIGADGEIADPATRRAIQQFVGGFVTFVRGRHGETTTA